VLRYKHETKATLAATNDDSDKVTVDSAKLWIANNKVVIDDQRMLFDETRPAEWIRVKYDATTVTLPDSTVTRVDEHQVTIDLSGNLAITSHLEGDSATIDITLTRRGALARGDVITDSETVAFDVKNVTMQEKRSDNGVTVEYKFDGNTGRHYLTVKGSTLAMPKPRDLTANFVQLSVPIPVPTTVVTANGNHHAEIDLAGDPSLAAIAIAMQDGRELTFKATLKGHESLGGYSPQAHRWFIALNTRALPGWDEAIVRRRLKLTIAHELGHSLQLTRETLRNLTTNSDDDNDLWYTNEHGGSGSHCHLNARLVASGASNGRETTTSGQVYSWDPDSGGQLCIMYHALDHEHMADQFCDRCLEHLKRGVANFGPP
jgi:hypothetical protein